MKNISGADEYSANNAYECDSSLRTGRRDICSGTVEGIYAWLNFETLVREKYISRVREFVSLLADARVYRRVKKRAYS